MSVECAHCPSVATIVRDEVAYCERCHARLFRLSALVGRMRRAGRGRASAPAPRRAVEV